MIREVKREELPIRMRIFDSNWNQGIMIGNIIIFTGRSRKEVKKINGGVYKKDNNTRSFLVKYNKERPVLNIIYIRK